VSRLIAAAAVLTLTAGCTTSQLASSPFVTKHLQLISAGYTGCLPEANEISNVTLNLDGSGMWNATCKAKPYLCTAVGSNSSSESFSCAPAVQ
jgi:hypothetical protein